MCIRDRTAGGKFYGQVIQIVLLIFAVKLIASLFSSVYGILLTKMCIRDRYFGRHIQCSQVFSKKHLLLRLLYRIFFKLYSGGI